MPLDLTPDRGLRFRITHVDNLPWLLRNGLHAANSPHKDSDFVAIGNADLIVARTWRPVPHPPGGTLPDYVPFCFTPKSPMLLNIKTGYNGVTRRPNEEIAILISSCKAMAAAGVSLLFTDRHAYTPTAAWTANAADLAELLDWDILRNHDFKREDGYPDKKERYQAEALAHRHVPYNALQGIACAASPVLSRIEAALEDSGARLKVFVRPGWYF